jgi:hypothetical protein
VVRNAVLVGIQEVMGMTKREERKNTPAWGPEKSHKNKKILVRPPPLLQGVNESF